jgi:hypothetical protein
MVDKIVMALLPLIVKFIETKLSNHADQRLAMLLLADRLKVRAHAQRTLDNS